MITVADNCLMFIEEKSFKMNVKLEMHKSMHIHTRSLFIQHKITTDNIKQVVKEGQKCCTKKINTKKTMTNLLEKSDTDLNIFFEKSLQACKCHICRM